MSNLIGLFIDSTMRRCCGYSRLFRKGWSPRRQNLHWQAPGLCPGMWQFQVYSRLWRKFSLSSLIVGVWTTDWKSLASSSQASSSESVGLLARVPDTITVFDNSDLPTFYKDVEFSSRAKGYRTNIPICVADLKENLIPLCGWLCLAGVWVVS